MPREAIDPGEFIVPRLAVTDVTIERLAGLLQARPGGLAVICDELAGLFSNMARYSNRFRPRILATGVDWAAAHS